MVDAGGGLRDAGPPEMWPKVGTIYCDRDSRMAGRRVKVVSHVEAQDGRRWVRITNVHDRSGRTTRVSLKTLRTRFIAVSRDMSGVGGLSDQETPEET